MDQAQSIPLILGGHSFIQQLGNDAQPSVDAQIAIVEACLDNGITWFDTTYQPERVALGRALTELGRRDEATIIAWNFFTDFDTKGQVGGPDYYQSHHLDLLQVQLQTDMIDCLVVHAMGDAAENARQETLAMEWQNKGYIQKLGTWSPPRTVHKEFGTENPYAFMVRPYNVTTKEAAPIFGACKTLGWENYACSPFVRGWVLDRFLAIAVQRFRGGEEIAMRAKLADMLLRYSLFRPQVDRLIVAMRDVKWIQQNIASYQRGPLLPEERMWLQAICTADA